MILAEHDAQGGPFNRGYLMKKLYFLGVWASLLIAPWPADADPIFGIFGGELERVAGNYDPATGQYDGFGLGLEIGDAFLGSFAYDSDSGVPLFLNAVVGGTLLVASDLDSRFNFDSVLDFAYVRGSIGGGLYMGFGLTRSGGVEVRTTPPMRLDSRDWYLTAFKIDDLPVSPVESGCCSDPESIYATGVPNSPNVFVRTVTEPSTFVLLGIGLAGIGFTKRARVTLRLGWS